MGSRLKGWMYCCSALVALAAVAPAWATSPDIVISQVYGGGGSTGSIYKSDFIELFNRGTSTVAVNGWSVQYASATGSSWNNTTVLPTGASIAPGHYYLIKQYTGTIGADLPTPDWTGTVNMGSTAGKVALCTNSTALTGTCPTGGAIYDFIGYGTTANCYEGAGPAPAPSTTLADIRANGGCTDTDNNNTDFATGTPTPRNSSSPTNPCGPPPTGACCIGEVCSITTQADCTGTWQGADTVCTPNPCLLPTGSCCVLEPYSCVTGVTQANCLTGTWTLNGACTTECVAPTGSCCNTTTYACTDGVTHAACAAPLVWTMGGTCAVTCIAPTGACCVGVDCTIQTETYCLQTLQGIYLGDGTTCAGGCPTYSGVVLNEIRIDQTGTDTDEYFEIAGPPGTSLSGLTYIVLGDASSCTIPGNGCRSGSIEAVVDLTGYSIPADGRFLVCEDIFLLRPLSEADLVLSSAGNVLNFENSDNVSHLLVAGFRGALNDRLDNDPPDGVIDITPWVTLLDAVSVRGAAGNPPTSETIEWIYDFTAYGFPNSVIGPDGTFFPGHVYRHNPGPPQTDGPGTPWNIGQFNPVGGDDTPGVPNILIGACCRGGDCTIESEFDCLDTGGLYKGTGTTCTPGICTGACCFVAAPCQLLTRAACTVQGGTYQGDGSDCTQPQICYCDSIAAARALPVGAGVRICGAVLSSKTSLIEVATSKSFQIQDTSGSGGQSAITVYGLTGVVDPIIFSANEGDLIDVQGTTYLYNGLLELVDGVVVGTRPLQLIANNGPLGIPAAVPVTSADFQYQSPTAEGYESEIVELRCVAFANIPAPPFHTFHGQTNYVVSDGAGLVTVRISTTNLDMVGQPIPTGVVNIRGIFSQYDTATPFDDYYQLAPRSLADFDLAPSNCPSVPLGACCVAGACRDNLPEAICHGIGGGWMGEGSLCESVTCPDPANVRINEIRIDQPGADNDEYFELIGTPGTPLGELTYIVIGDGTGGSGVIENVTPLTLSAIPADGVFLCARSAFTLNPAAVDLVFNLVFENDDNVTHLLVRGFTGSNGQDLDTNDDGVLDLTPWAAIVDEVAVVKELNPPTTTEWYYSTVTVGPDTTPELVPFHVYRCPGGPPDWLIGTQDPLALLSRDTPGVANDCEPPGACCYADYTCAITTQAACTGTWLGADTTCDQCPQPTGACCNQTTGACTIVTQATCTAGGGNYQGNNTSCTPNPCPQPCALLGDVNVDGVVNGLDIAGFVRAKLGQAPLPGENQACANYGGTLEQDIAAFTADLLN